MRLLALARLLAELLAGLLTRLLTLTRLLALTLTEQLLALTKLLLTLARVAALLHLVGRGRVHLRAHVLLLRLLLLLVGRRPVRVLHVDATLAALLLATLLAALLTALLLATLLTALLLAALRLTAGAILPDLEVADVRVRYSNPTLSRLDDWMSGTHCLGSHWFLTKSWMPAACLLTTPLMR